jgi:hypothetical protein
MNQVVGNCGRDMEEDTTQQRHGASQVAVELKPTNTRVYLRTADGLHRSLFWVRNNKPNEMLIGLYGLSRKTPLLRHQWPEQEVEDEGLGSLRYYFDKTLSVGVPVDHITCHADGQFHIKTLDEKLVYLHTMKRTAALGADTELFLEFTMIVDRPEKYEVSTAGPKAPNVTYDVPLGSYLYIYGCFSGSHFPLESEISAMFARFGGTPRVDSLMLGSLQGRLISGLADSDPAAHIKRPTGTFLSFKFPLAADRWRLKTFQFE